MLCYERVLFAIYILSPYRSSSSTMMMDIPRCKRMAGGWYSTFGTHERNRWYACIYVYCPVLMMMLLKWNVCCVGVVHYNETWEKRRERRGEREGKIYEEKHKHIYITLAPIIERFHSVLLTSHRCAWISTKEKRERKKNEKCRNGHVLLRYSFSLSLSPSLLHLLSAIVVFLFYIHTCLIIVTSSSSSSSSSCMHIRYVLFLMGNLITCMIEQLEKEKEGKTHVK